MRKIILLTAMLLTACSGGSDDDTPAIVTYEDCQMAGGEMRFNEPHECHIFGDVFYDKTPLAKFVDYGPATGYFASPVGSGSYPAVVLIHERWGLSKHIWSIARMLAEQGYVVLAVDLYDGEVTTDMEEAQELASGVREDLDGTLEHIAGAVHWLSLLHNVDDTRIGALGWDFGEGWAREMAENSIGVQASVLYYGRFNAVDDLGLMSAQIMESFGEDGQTIPADDAKAFRAKRASSEEEYQILVYPNEVYGFTKDLTPAAKNAWEHTLEFLNEQLAEM